MIVNLRHFFILIIIVNFVALLFFFSYNGKGPGGKTRSGAPNKDPFLQKIDTKTIFGRRNNTTPAKKTLQNKTINIKIIKPKKPKKKEKLDPFMNYNIFQNSASTPTSQEITSMMTLI